MIAQNFKHFHMRAGAIVCVLSILIQSCSSTNRILPSDYSELGENEPNDFTDYRIELHDGTKYIATNISTNDSTLTIVAIPRSDNTRSNVSISDKLPYSIPLREVESIELRKSSNIYIYIVVVIAIIVIAIPVLKNNMSIEGFD